MRRSIEDRLMRKTYINFPGCWEWMGLKSKAGYGKMKGKTNLGDESLVHRLSYYIHKGDLIKGKVIAHSCDNRNCVNPEHLLQWSQKDNVRDMFKKKRNVSHNSIKTHCKNGHEFNKENTKIRRNGSRQCKECLRINLIKWSKNV